MLIYLLCVLQILAASADGISPIDMHIGSFEDNKLPHLQQKRNTDVRNWTLESYSGCLILVALKDRIGQMDANTIECTDKCSGTCFKEVASGSVLTQTDRVIKCAMETCDGFRAIPNIDKILSTVCDHGGNEIIHSCITAMCRPANQFTTKEQDIYDREICCIDCRAKNYKTEDDIPKTPLDSQPQYKDFAKCVGYCDCTNPPECNDKSYFAQFAYCSCVDCCKKQRTRKHTCAEGCYQHFNKRFSPFENELCRFRRHHFETLNFWCSDYCKWIAVNDHYDDVFKPVMPPAVRTWMDSCQEQCQELALSGHPVDPYMNLSNTCLELWNCIEAVEVIELQIISNISEERVLTEAERLQYELQPYNYEQMKPISNTNSWVADTTADVGYKAAVNRVIRAKRPLGLDNMFIDGIPITIKKRLNDYVSTANALSTKLPWPEIKHGILWLYYPDGDCDKDPLYHLGPDYLDVVPMNFSYSGTHDVPKCNKLSHQFQVTYVKEMTIVYDLIVRITSKRMNTILTSKQIRDAIALRPGWSGLYYVRDDTENSVIMRARATATISMGMDTKYHGSYSYAPRCVAGAIEGEGVDTTRNDCKCIKCQ